MTLRFAAKDAARQSAWDRLAAAGEAREPLPPHGRIPNLAGARTAAVRLFEEEPWRSARSLKINPDSPQRPVRLLALLRGSRVFVPTPRLAGGFMLLDPARIPPVRLGEAATRATMDRWAEPVPVATTVHDLQVVDDFPIEPTDLPLHRCASGDGAPAPLKHPAREKLW